MDKAIKIFKGLNVSKNARRNCTTLQHSTIIFGGYMQAKDWMISVQDFLKPEGNVRAMLDRQSFIPLS